MTRHNNGNYIKFITKKQYNNSVKQFQFTFSALLTVPPPPSRFFQSLNLISERKSVRRVYIRERFDG